MWLKIAYEGTLTKFHPVGAEVTQVVVDMDQADEEVIVVDVEVVVGNPD
jgi:hypothetical protein